MKKQTTPLPRTKFERIVTALLALLIILVSIQFFMIYRLSTTNQNIRSAYDQIFKNHNEFMRFRYEYEQSHDGKNQ